MAWVTSSRRHALHRWLGLAIALQLLSSGGASAVDVYLDPATFIARAFADDPPAPARLWISGDLKSGVKAILGTALGALRVKYWRRGERTAWILEAIGRDRPITAGFVVDGDTIAGIEILIYRESRGWEVRYPFFTDQFKGAELQANQELTHKIDGITGATLSVHAIIKLGKVALLLDKATDKMEVP